MVRKTGPVNEVEEEVAEDGAFDPLGEEVDSSVEEGGEEDKGEDVEAGAPVDVDEGKEERGDKEGGKRAFFGGAESVA